MLKIALPLVEIASSTNNYIEALVRSGALPMLGEGLRPEVCDGLLLPGGVDVDPSLYGQEKDPTTEFEQALDRLQLDTLRRFLEARRPVFGICRGHQLINVALGGTLIQDLPTAGDHKAFAGKDSVHSCESVPGTFISGLFGPSFQINSSHHQGVDRPGNGLRVAARAGDGVVEAMEHETLPVWSVQFHPERMCFQHARPDTADGSLLFRFFLEKCRS